MSIFATKKDNDIHEQADDDLTVAWPTDTLDEIDDAMFAAAIEAGREVAKRSGIAA